MLLMNDGTLMDCGAARPYRQAMLPTFRVLAISLTLVFFAPGVLQAHEYNLGPLKIGHPWARATPKGAAVAGGYLKITNTGTTSDRLIGGTAAFAGRFEIHEMSEQGGVMKMRHLPNGIEIKPGETVEFKPGSFHVMFMDLKQPLVKDQKPRPKG